MAMHALDSATISFGLVAIPIKVYTTNETGEQIHFHMIHAGCGERLKQQYVCPEHGPVERSEIGKGYELSKGTNLELSKEELKTLEAVSTSEVLLTEFVPAAAVDPLYLDKTYYLGTDKGGERGYRLLRDAMAKTEVVGIASYSARGKQYVVMVRPFEDGLCMHQLRYPDEIKPWSEVPVKAVGKVAPAEIELAEKIIEQVTRETFDPTQYHDEVKDRVRALLRDKAKGKELVVEERDQPKPMVDLMEALKASLAGGDGARASGKNGHSRPKRATRKAGAANHTAPKRTKRATKATHRTSRSTRGKSSRAAA
jgi:DNA end-binding protein Ku